MFRQMSRFPGMLPNQDIGQNRSKNTDYYIAHRELLFSWQRVSNAKFTESYCDQLTSTRKKKQIRNELKAKDTLFLSRNHQNFILIYISKMSSQVYICYLLIECSQVTTAENKTRKTIQFFDRWTTLVGNSRFPGQIQIRGGGFSTIYVKYFSHIMTKINVKSMST